MGAIEEQLRKAIEHHQVGALDEAHLCYEEVLLQSPDHLRALEMLGVLFVTKNQLNDAKTCFDKVLAIDPQHSAVLNNSAIVCRRLGRSDDALVIYRRLLHQNPDYFDAALNLANLLVEREEFDEAIQLYTSLKSRAPDNESVCLNLAIALSKWDGFRAATRVLEDFLALAPTSIAARNTLGVMLSENSETKAAIEQFQYVLRLSPEHIEAQNNLGLALLDAGADADAKKVLENALHQAPQSPELHGNLATIYRRQGYPAQAAKMYKATIALRPDPVQKVRLATLFPIIPASRQAIEDARDVFETSIDQLVQDKLRLADPVRDVHGMHFHLSFHDADNRPLFEKVSGFYRSACPLLNYASPHCQAPARAAGRKIRVGFISRYFRNHAVGWCYSGMLRFLPKERLAITAITFGGGEDEVWRSIADDVDATMTLPMNLARAREQISAAQFDVLFYTDIGMEPFSYFLAFSRLAPVQCVTNGHPDTTGISTLDYFISDANMSPPEDSSKYSETLVNLPGAVAYYQRPDFPENLLTRDALGLPEDKTIYLCPQSLFKIHPDMDFWFRDILAADKNGVIVIFEGPCRDWSRLLLKRFSGIISKDMDRILTLPRMPYESFLRILTYSDVILDTWPFSGGNTSHQAIAAGVPVVTLPSRFARGRVTFSLYQTMGITEAIVATDEEYVDVAIKFGTDRNKRMDYSAVLAAKSPLLFGETGSLLAYEEFLFKSAVKKI